MNLNDEIVSLSGTSGEVGRVFGRVSRAAIRRDVGTFLEVAAGSGLAPGEIERRVDRYRSIVTRVAPHWLEEIAAIALAAGVPEADYTAHVAQKYVLKGPPASEPPHECTSVLSIGTATAGGGAILHKNRDSVARAQGAWIRAVAGTHRYLGGGDSSDHGDTYFLNEYGLAGAMNAGSPNDDAVDEGLPTPQILRLIAESAKTCEDALAILGEVVREGWYTNGGNGSIWLFVSPDRALIVENTLSTIDHLWLEDDVAARANDFLLPKTFPFSRPDALTNTRYQTARMGVQQSQGRMTVGDMHRLSRDTSSEPRRICGESTVSAFTAVPDPSRPDLLSMAWIALGNPGNTVYVPYFVGAEGVPAFAMDGTLWELSTRLQTVNLPDPHFALDPAEDEDSAAMEQSSLKDEIASLMASDKGAAVAGRLTAASAKWARRVADRLCHAGEDARPVM